MQNNSDANGIPEPRCRHFQDASRTACRATRAGITAIRRAKARTKRFPTA